MVHHTMPAVVVKQPGKTGSSFGRGMCLLVVGIVIGIAISTVFKPKVPVTKLPVLSATISSPSPSPSGDEKINKWDAADNVDESYVEKVTEETTTPETPQPAVPTEQQQKNLKQCTNFNEATSGKLISIAQWTLWKPETCVLPWKFNMNKCLANMGKGKRVALYGDSLLRDTVKKLTRTLSSRRTVKFSTCDRPGRVPKTWCDERSRRFVMGKGMLEFYWTPSALYAGAFKDPSSIESMKKSDHIYVSSGMWDMGAHHRSPIHFYNNLKSRVRFIKSLMKPTAKLTIIPLHWLHTESNCSPNQRCRRCNSPKKAGVYREALLMVAACENVDVFDATSMTRNGSKHTHDGAHYNRFFQAEAAVLMNDICRDDFHFEKPSIPCDEEAAKKRWATVKEAKIACQ
eukprot:TRINITY_DN1608_c0_g4_i2.p1 TRINITY_DN1608_c0_g4~~TRINITY_DN1608_c0_g4_i2.p1  ORF type:complete len:417 (+),score=56.94 TRINITY_DN1608_c0_g4_i2:50-1252(+)